MVSVPGVRQYHLGSKEGLGLSLGVHPDCCHLLLFSINWSARQERFLGPHSSFNYSPRDSWQLGRHNFSFPNRLHAVDTCSKGLYPLLYNKSPIT